MVPLYNGGDTKAEYEVGVAAFQTLTTMNFHVPLIECLQPRGTIDPGQRLLLEFLFSPIEAMKYSVSIHTVLIWLLFWSYHVCLPILISLVSQGGLSLSHWSL